MTENENQKLNPQICELEIGVRNLRKIKIYPLAFGHQMKTTQLISQTVAAFMEAEADDTAFITFIVGIIQDNIQDIIGYVVDEDPEEILFELSNDQVVSIAWLIFEMNYRNSLKNVMSLFGEIKSLFQSKRPSQPSVNVMDTSSETSTEEVSEMEDSHSDK